MHPLPERPTVRIEDFIHREQALLIQPGESGYGDRGYIEAYGLDGVCRIRIENLPPCTRETDEEWEKDSEGNWPEAAKVVPHVHKPWCHSFGLSIPFVRGPMRRVRLLKPHVGTNGKEYHYERNAWGWDGNREKPSLTPSFLMSHFHATGNAPVGGGDLPGVWIHFHCFLGDPYGPGTGRFGPGALDLLESHIKTRDGRQVPMVLA